MWAMLFLVYIEHNTNKLILEFAYFVSSCKQKFIGTTTTFKKHTLIFLIMYIMCMNSVSMLLIKNFLSSIRLV